MKEIMIFVAGLIIGGLYIRALDVRIVKAKIKEANDEVAAKFKESFK